MSTETKQVKRVCKCENCGNEAEMLVTCTLEPTHDHKKNQVNQSDETGTAKRHVKGKGTCTSCGNEADMWIDL